MFERRRIPTVIICSSQLKPNSEVWCGFLFRW